MIKRRPVAKVRISGGDNQSPGVPTRRHRYDDMLATGRDDLDEYIEERSADPEFRSALEDEEERARLLQTLVQRRQTLALNQAEVAARMKTTQSAVSDLERGTVDHRITTVQRYARAVECELRFALSACSTLTMLTNTFRLAATWTTIVDVDPPVWPELAEDPRSYWLPLVSFVSERGVARSSAIAGPVETSVSPVVIRSERSVRAVGAGC